MPEITKHSGSTHGGNDAKPGAHHSATPLPNTGGGSAWAGVIGAVTAALGGLALLIRGALRCRVG